MLPLTGSEHLGFFDLPLWLICAVIVGGLTTLCATLREVSSVITKTALHILKEFRKLRSGYHDGK